ncbi:MAG: hypothetical protein ACRDJI_02260 [Actinomycetota bacterium]
MSSHDLWHIAVLGSTLFGAAGLLIVALGPLVLDSPRGAARARPFVLGLLALAGFLLLLEWLVVH